MSHESLHLLPQLLDLKAVYPEQSTLASWICQSHGDMGVYYPLREQGPWKEGICVLSVMAYPTRPLSKAVLRAGVKE